MGIFDFFKKKPAEPEPSDPNEFFLEVLQKRLQEENIQSERSPKYAALVLNDGCEIASGMAPGDFHPSMLPMMVAAIHKEYFPKGIQESVVGVGNSLREKVESAVNAYLSTTFFAIADAFEDGHNEKLDFMSGEEESQILWHPKPGDLGLQGIWKEAPEYHDLYEVVRDLLPPMMDNRKFNWLKMYMSRQPDGTLGGEVYFNNAHWEEGMNLLAAYAQTWGNPGVFLGQKQFVMFRRCDSYD